jgi:hypothetical protein
MRRNKIMISAVAVVCVVGIAIAAQASGATGDWLEALSSGVWIPQGLQAWGDDRLAVDFGSRGLWSYNGVWVQLSRLDPQAMTSWGGANLAVDFGPYGLWTFDGQAWSRISL